MGPTPPAISRSHLLFSSLTTIDQPFSFFCGGRRALKHPLPSPPRIPLPPLFPPPPPLSRLSKAEKEEGRRRHPHQASRGHSLFLPPFSAAAVWNGIHQKADLPPVRLELTTPGLRDQCSAAELWRRLASTVALANVLFPPPFVPCGAERERRKERGGEGRRRVF